MGIPRTVAVEGPIGVGKTALARLLAERFGGRCVLEDAAENPFLEAFYRDRKRYALQTQLYFLLTRYAQQEAMAQDELFEGPVFCDYLFARDRIFAAVNLEGGERWLHEQVARLLVGRVPKPDLVVYLQARPEVLLARLRKRAGRLDHKIDLAYLEEVTEAYSEYFFRYDETPLLVVNTSEIDFVASPEDLDELCRAIRKAKRGRQFYAPLGSR